MRLRAAKNLCMCLFCLLVSTPGFSDYPIEVIELKSRPLDEILPVIQPFLGTDGTATGMGNNLVIKASPARVKEIRRLLVTLDRPPRRLVLTVGNQHDVTRSSSGYRANADIKAGDSRFSINSPGYPVDSSRAHIRIHDNNVQRTRTSRHRVQALEGRPAYISSGSRIPLQTTGRYYDQGVPYQRHTTQLQDVTSGFYVVPRLNGDEVTLEIVQHDDQPGRRRGVINTQSSGTVVRGRLGEWVELGGVDTATDNQQGGLGQSVNSRETGNRGIQVKVECLDCENESRQLQDFEWKQ
jgi:type II secretory pathway component GspD/PulD (secretin)